MNNLQDKLNYRQIENNLKIFQANHQFVFLKEVYQASNNLRKLVIDNINNIIYLKVNNNKLKK